MEKSTQIQKMNKDRTILTYKGAVIDVFDPKPEQILIEDIAHGLSHTCRFGGQCHNYYSVAEHSIRVSQLCPPKLKLEGLLHDASEAYLTDMPRPIKKMLPEYKSVESKLMKVIAAKFGFWWPLSKEVHDADMKAFWEEWNQGSILSHIDPIPPPVAKDRFMDTFRRLATLI